MSKATNASGQQGSSMPQNPKPRTHLDWGHLPGDIANGWWLLFAEVLAVIVLVVLASTTGPVAAAMSGELDTMALAALARSDPVGLCTEGSTAHVVMGRKVSNARVVFSPFGSAPPAQPGLNNFDQATATQQRFATEVVANLNMASVANDVVTELAPRGMLWAWPGEGKGLFNSSADAFEAMVRCGIIVGAYADIDLPPYVARQCAKCDSSLRSVAGGLAWPSGKHLMSARLQSEQLQDGQSTSAELSASIVGLRNYMSFLPPNSALHSAPQVVGRVTWQTTFFLPKVWWPHHTTMLAVAKSSYAVFPHPLIPAGILRVDAQQDGVASRSVWLKVAEQSNTIAACMARHAHKSVVLTVEALNGKFSIRVHANDSVTNSSAPVSGMTGTTGFIKLGLVDDIWIKLKVPLLEMLDSGMFGEPYTCTGGIDMSSPQADATLTKLVGYRSAAKSQYNTTLFGTMANLSYDDVYAVYTAVLGALFGAMALLVTTLFVYVVAIMKRIALGHHGQALIGPTITQQQSVMYPPILYLV